MIITLKGADFSTNNIGTLTTWSIFTNIGTGASYSGANAVGRGDSYSGTVTLTEGYEIGSAGVTVTMGGTDITSTAVSTSGSTVTITIGEVTGTVYISVPTKNTATGEEDDGNAVWLELPVTKYAIGVTTTGTGRVSSNNAKRFSTANSTTPNAILIPAGQSMTLKGLASGTYPLRVDYIYITDNVVCPAEGSTTPIEGLVGTASNYNSSKYFPLNTDGADTLTITNNYGEDYYFYFGFAGLTLNEGILAEFDTYDIKYKIA